jgi:hypothetical protein
MPAVNVSPPMPIPPTTCSAPVFVEFELAVLVTFTFGEINKEPAGLYIRLALAPRLAYPPAPVTIVIILSGSAPVNAVIYPLSLFAAKPVVIVDVLTQVAVVDCACSKEPTAPRCINAVTVDAA